MISMALGLIPSSIASASLPIMVRGGSPKIPRLGGLSKRLDTPPPALCVGISSKSFLALLGRGFPEHWAVLSILSLTAIPGVLISNSLSRINRDKDLKRAAIGASSLAILSSALANTWGVEGLAITYLALTLTPTSLLKGIDLGHTLKTMASKYRS
jgi:hypothetical protein